MANTVYGPYVPGASPWTGTTGINTTRLNNFETQASVALHGINSDLASGSTGFILTGVTPSGTVATTTVNIASGTAYLVMSDGTLGKIAVGATTQTTSALSSTYHLYLQPDGTWYWSTSNSPAASSLAIATVTTNGSGQIATITDLRPSNGAVPALGVCAQANAQSVSVTTDVTITTYNPSVDGWYRVTMQVAYINATPQKPTAKINFYAPDAGSYASNFFRSAQDGQWYNGSQTSVTGNNQEIIFEALTFRNKAGQAFGVHFQDPGGTPADIVSVLIERLS